MTAIDVDLSGDLVSTEYQGEVYEGMGLEITGAGNVSGSPGELHVSSVSSVKEYENTVHITTY